MNRDDQDGQPSIRDVINPRQQKLLRLLWLNGPLSRWELHEQTGFTPNVCGALVDSMLQAGFIRECAPEPAPMGRPRVPLEIDPSSRHVLGLALVPGHVDITKFGLTGEVIGKPASRKVNGPGALVATAAGLLKEQLNSDTLAVGITSTGFLDPVDKRILLSSALPGRNGESLIPIFEAAGETVALLQNDSHALAARWFLTHRAEQQQDLLIVWYSDGRLGATLLVDGRPNRGVMTGGNELGHTRFPGIETEKCFCGKVGCLERIVSSEFLWKQDEKRSGSSNHTLLKDRVAQFTTIEQDPALGVMMSLFAQGLSNAINLLRLHRLVLVSPYTHQASFNEELLKQIRSLALPDLSHRTQIDLWDQPSAGSAENAGWLVLAEMMYGGWDALGQRPRLEAKSTRGRVSLHI